MSDPRKAEQLLGGHAAGILTPGERARLFAAALEDQALFDTLADEEALRDLLADPAARARLLQALQPRPARPFWRRPGVLALAAGLIGAAWIGLLRQPAKDLAERRTPTELAPPAPSAPRAADAPRVLAGPGRATVPRGSRLGKVAPAPPPSTADKAASAGGLSEATPEASERRKAADRPAQLAPGGAAEAGAAPIPSPAPSPPPAPAAAPSEGLGAAQGGVIGTAAIVDTSSVAVTDAGHPPAWAFTGPGILQVAWGPGGEIYLLRRSAKGAALLRPAREQTQADGRRTRVYQVPSDGSTLDLYWLPSGTEPPERLAPEAPPGGTWTRIR